MSGRSTIELHPAPQRRMSNVDTSVDANVLSALLILPIINPNLRALS